MLLLRTLGDDSRHCIWDLRCLNVYVLLALAWAMTVNIQVLRVYGLSLRCLMKFSSLDRHFAVIFEVKCFVHLWQSSWIHHEPRTIDGRGCEIKVLLSCRHLPCTGLKRARNNNPLSIRRLRIKSLTVPFNLLRRNNISIRDHRIFSIKVLSLVQERSLWKSCAVGSIGHV